MSLAAALGFGFLLGVKHAADADHVVAVSTIVAKRPKGRSAWLLGAVWGAGHTATILVVGVALAYLKLEISPRVGLALEFCVGVVLVVLGVLSASGLLPSPVTAHTHAHSHDGHHKHEHPHFHLDADAKGFADLLKQAGTAQLARSAFVGFVHGLAGSAAVALLASAAMPDPKSAVAYLAVFGAGTVVGMLSLSWAMARSMELVAGWWAPGERALAVATGLLSLAFGALIVYETAFSPTGFLSSTPSWNPH